MTNQIQSQVYLSYSEDNRDFIETLARCLQGDARLSFWFGPWHSIPGEPIQEQMEEALWQAQSCAVFVSDPSQIKGWQNEQMRVAIQNRVEDESSYRVIPVLLPGTTPPKRRDLPRFLRLYEAVEFRSLDDEQAFKRLLAGVLGIPPIQVEGYIEAEINKEQLPAPPSAVFEQGYALVIGVANYPRVSPLPNIVLNDAHALQKLLTSPACGYPATNVTQLLDDQATADGIRNALTNLATRTGQDDTVVIFFSGHGGHEDSGDETRQYLIPYDCDPDDLAGTAISGEEMTGLLRNINASRLLVLFDSCHSSGAGDPKSLLPQLKTGLSESYYEGLARGKGRVVIASSRPEEFSWALEGMDNSLFTHYLLEALRGQTKTLGDGYVRVFDIFRHVADHVPARAAEIRAMQHPIFKATAMEEDFPIALVGRQTDSETDQRNNHWQPIPSGVDQNVVDNRASLRRQLDQYTRNLNQLHEQAAIYGAGETPLYLLNKIEVEEIKIEEIEQRLNELEGLIDPDK